MQFQIISVLYPDTDIEMSVKSILDQTVGFRENIKLYLVLSPELKDSDRTWCKESLEQFPANVTVTEGAGSDVASLWNAVLPLNGDGFFGFSDSTCVWKTDAFQKVLAFYEEHPVHMISCRLLTVQDPPKQWSHLDYRFKNDHIVKTDEQFNEPEDRLCGTFFRFGDGVCPRIDTTYGELAESIFVTEAIEKHGKYGVAKSAFCRSDIHVPNSPGVRLAAAGEEERLRVLKKVSDRFAKDELSDYHQYLLITLLTHVIRTPVSDGMRDGALAVLRSLVNRIRDDIICCQRHLQVWYKAQMMELKYGTSDFDHSLLRKHLFCHVIIAKEKGNRLHLEGYWDKELLNEGSYFVFTDGKGNVIPHEVQSFIPVKAPGAAGEARKPEWYQIDLPLTNGSSYQCIITSDAGNQDAVQMKFGKFSRICDYPTSFCEMKDHLVRYREKALFVEEKTRRALKKARQENLQWLKKNVRPDIVALRENALALKKKLKKPVWLISDRSDRANDNGEWFFRYLMSQPIRKQYDIRFAIEAGTQDHKRMSEIGPVISYGTDEYKTLFFAASKIISAGGEDWAMNPIGDQIEYLRDLREMDYVYLQHGVTEKDLSGWLKKSAKNINMLVTTAKEEQESIINGNYGYDASVVKLTGMPRFDALRDDREKLICLAPTWRKPIAGDLIPGTSHREYRTDFKESDFFRFYNGLLNHSGLLQTMEQYGYKGIFFIHPSFAEQIGDFEENDIFRIWENMEDDRSGRYRDELMLSKSSLMITDYSSIAMDFCYLNKPVIYTQFDQDTFFLNHTYEKGFFDYERDGFGPVVYDLESAADAIIKSVQNECPLLPEYEERIHRFFAYHDKENSSRVLQEILKME